MLHLGAKNPGKKEHWQLCCLLSPLQPMVITGLICTSSTLVAEQDKHLEIKKIQRREIIMPLLLKLHFVPLQYIIIQFSIHLICTSILPNNFQAYLSQFLKKTQIAFCPTNTIVRKRVAFLLSCIHIQIMGTITDVYGQNTNILYPKHLRV